MNYIILSRTTSERITERYTSYCKNFDYSYSIEEYIEHILSFEGNYIISSRYTESNDIQLIGNQCYLTLDIDKKHSNWFYAKSITYKTIFNNFSDTISLPGKWDVVLFEDSRSLYEYNTYPIKDIISQLRPSKKGITDFSVKLFFNTWDKYSTFLRDNIEQAAALSLKDVIGYRRDCNLFILQCSLPFSDSFKIGKEVQFTQNNKDFFKLGIITALNQETYEIEVLCDNEKLISDICLNKTKDIKIIRIVDTGAIAKLNKEKKALKRLYLDEAANEHLKEILTLEHTWANDISSNEITVKDTIDLFGSNLRQKEAFQNAINSPNLFLIQGPPGTGKTTIITELVKYITKSGSNVLISSETHVAVDNVLERIIDTDNVVPVRLGNPEHITEVAANFMPNTISETFLKTAKEKNTAFNLNGINEQSLIDDCIKTYRSKEEELIKRINIIQQKLPIVDNNLYLYRKVTDFESLKTEINDIYGNLILIKNEYYTLNSTLNDLKIQKANLVEKIKLAEDSPNSFVFDASKNHDSASLSQIKNDLNLVEEKIKRNMARLSGNKYMTLLASYERKIKRYNRFKEELITLLGCRNSIISRVHEVRISLEDIIKIKEQISLLHDAKEKELEKIKYQAKRKMELWELSADIRTEWMQIIDEPSVKNPLEQIYIQRANVVFATCAGIASTANGVFAEKDYDYVIVDEAAKCNFPDLLIPLVMGKKLILVGDHKQLLPLLDTEDIEEKMTEDEIKTLKESVVFKLLYEQAVPDNFKTMLDRQYRMEKNISTFVSDHFYNGNLKCERDLEDNESMLWIDCENSKEEKYGTSYINKPEADDIISLLSKLDRSFNKFTSVGVICIYKAQAAYIKNLASKNSFHNLSIEFNTVDAFQGKEKQIIIFNIGRSKMMTSFMNDINRVNVAISRAQDKLYVIGSSSLIKKKGNCILKDLYEYIKERHCIRNSKFVMV